MPRLASGNTVQPVPLEQFWPIYAPQVKDLVDHSFNKFTKQVHKLLREIRHIACFAGSPDMTSGLYPYYGVNPGLIWHNILVSVMSTDIRAGQQSKVSAGVTFRMIPPGYRLWSAMSLGTKPYAAAVNDCYKQH